MLIYHIYNILKHKKLHCYLKYLPSKNVNHLLNIEVVGLTTPLLQFAQAVL